MHSERADRLRALVAAQNAVMTDMEADLEPVRAAMVAAYQAGDVETGDRLLVRYRAMADQIAMMSWDRDGNAHAADREEREPSRINPINPSQ